MKLPTLFQISFFRIIVSASLLRCSKNSFGSVRGRRRSPMRNPDRFETLAREPALPMVWMAGLVYFGPSFT